MGARCGYQRQERVAPSSHIQRKTSSEHEEEKIGLVERLEYSPVVPLGTIVNVRLAQPKCGHFGLKPTSHPPRCLQRGENGWVGERTWPSDEEVRGSVVASARQREAG